LLLIDNGQFLLAEIIVNEKVFCLVNVYGPNNDSPDFFPHLFDQIQSLSSYEVILGGDFNLVLNNDRDKLGGSPQHNNYKASAAAVNAHMQTMGLCDICRALHQYTKCLLEFSKTHS